MGNKQKSWKGREGVVYSTSSAFEYQYNQQKEQHTLPKNQQNLLVTIDKSGRAGKQVTLVSGFIGTAADRDALTKLLKSRCGVGGSSKDGDILIQGDLRDKVVSILEKEGYRARRGN